MQGVVRYTDEILMNSIIISFVSSVHTDDSLQRTRVNNIYISTYVNSVNFSQQFDVC